MAPLLWLRRGEARNRSLEEKSSLGLGQNQGRTKQWLGTEAFAALHPMVFRDMGTRKKN